MIRHYVTALIHDFNVSLIDDVNPSTIDAKQEWQFARRVEAAKSSKIFHSSARPSGQWCILPICGCEKHYWLRGAAQYTVVHRATSYSLKQRLLLHFHHYINSNIHQLWNPYYWKVFTNFQNDLIQGTEDISK